MNIGISTFLELKTFWRIRWDIGSQSWREKHFLIYFLLSLGDQDLYPHLLPGARSCSASEVTC